jgi:CheY-like chemotaxis protein
MPSPLPEDRFQDPYEFHLARIEHYLELACERRSLAQYHAARRLLARLLALEPRHAEALRMRHEIAGDVDRHRMSPPGRRSWHGLALLVDQDDRVVAGLLPAFRSSGFGVLAASNVREAAEILAEWTPDVVLSDVNFAGGSEGLGLFHAVRSEPRLIGTAFVFLAALLDRHLMIAGRRMGVDDMLQKPVDPDVAVAAAFHALRRRRPSPARALAV